MMVKWQWGCVLMACALVGCQNVREDVCDFFEGDNAAQQTSQNESKQGESYFTKDDDRPGLFSGEKGYFNVTPGSAHSDLPGQKRTQRAPVSGDQPSYAPTDLEKQAAAS